ncbi:glycoside hydrolase family 3 N-terminal domain-containing protein [Galbibacter pacificus]|uniref:beta-N-acetylhexosaminidase n=1 Tax=Galbibacter pacificus TaxID=2996052 RepID=A0ABT6FPC8_9FLAO|nr:glycoside hydrolase family 3 N-terminal domain-containing protein [Galbibacter pacificus]MDG3581631.1 glycoside hydrolase family 3 N-terminal domain-containing protein [Galbibacter pacificus]MDG3585109.1 serine hydrolase [Galbibacter pacificus]
MVLKKNVFVVVFLCGFLNLSAQGVDPLITSDYQQQKAWVDSVYNALTLQEKIGQLFMIRAFTDKGQEHIQKVKNLVSNYQVGGVIFSTGGPYRQAKINNELQDLSKVKMMMAMDAEWGLSMRLDSTFAFPYNMALGAVKDTDLIRRVGKHIGEHCKRLGMQINFAPDVDINTNPKNPIIGNRSFGENRDKVAQKTLAFMQGMQSAGVLANAKHFPGHGDTEQDSHKTLPTINFSEERIDSVELYPYKQLIPQGLASIMVAHLNVPSLESRDGFPSSLSEGIVTGLLKEKLHFNGLIFTDALEMKGVANYADSDNVDLSAFLAGNDMLLISGDTPEGIKKLKEAYDEGVITEERLAYSVKKVLKAKYKVGLNDYHPVKMENLYEDLNRVEDTILYEEVMENAITVAKNDEQQIPVRDLDKKKIAYVGFGDGEHQSFLTTLQKYAEVDYIQASTLSDMVERLQPYNLVIIGHHRSTETPWKAADFTNEEKVWIYEIARLKKVILDAFVKPYALLDLQSIDNIESIVISFQNDAIAQEKSAEILFGALSSKGSLPVMAHQKLPENRGFLTNSLSRLGYSVPERVGMNSKVLKKVDSVMNTAISSGVTPGGQILIARNGKVVYSKNFGRFDYGRDAEKVQSNSIYDLASLTKITATLPNIMQLVENGELTFNTTLGEMIPELRGSNKSDLKLLAVLSHYARLTPWIPFYLQTLDEGTKKPLEKYYHEEPNKKFSTQVADHMYIRNDYKDTIFERIKESELLPKLEYKYSDLPFLLLQKYLEDYYKESLDAITQERFYKSLGMNYTTFKPLDKFKKGEIVPTEVDDYFRYQTIQGYVHDMGAAMLGGVGGHAGLFSTSNDLAKMMQMYLQKGYYGGRRYFSAATLDKFNTCYYCEEDNRRGVGFDKPQLGTVGPTCGCVSMTSFGHSGFTGTYAWVDPVDNLVYIFLSNRTYPTMMNRKLITEGTRTVIQEIIYESIER